jgi:IS30 family transposase
MSYLHFTQKERIKLEAFLDLGYSIRNVAILLGRNHSAISREIKRNKNETGIYDSSYAHQQYMKTNSIVVALVSNYHKSTAAFYLVT